MRSRSLVSVVLGALALSLLTWAGPARADGETREADALFAEGRELLERGRYGDACEKLRRSQELAPAVGTLLNLGYCWEQLGKLKSSVDAYAEAEALATAGGDTKRAAFAKERLAAVQPRVVKLVVRVAAPLPDLVVTRNGVNVPEAEFDKAVAVDAGDIVIGATAKGHQPWRGVILVRGEGSVVTVIVPELVKDDGGGSKGKGERIDTRRLVALGLGGVAAATIGAGIGLALGAKSRHDDSLHHCDGAGCDETGVAMQQGAVAQGNVATVLIVFGLVCVGGGAYLWLGGGDHTKPGAATARSPARSRPPSEWRPRIGMGGIGATFW